MKKLTAKEIIDIIEENGISVSQFAHGDFGPSDDFVFSPELQAKVDKYNEIKDAYYNHPEFDKFRWDVENASQEFKDAIKAYKEATYPWSECKDEWSKSVGLGPWEEVSKKGGMDEGSEWYSVKYFKDHDVYIRTDGYYQSHHGTDFYDGYGEEVFPEQKTITVYEKK